MIRVASILLALFVAAQSTAVASERMVCRYTGKVMENCPCPDRGAAPVVEKAGCCTVLRGGKPSNHSSLRARNLS
jgi:hypothetical protein